MIHRRRRPGSTGGSGSLWAVRRRRGGAWVRYAIGVLLVRLLACSNDERGDVPGWVLVTAMTVALVMMIWGVASDALRDILGRFLDGLRFGS
jgi:hypothetical protein